MLIIKSRETYKCMQYHLVTACAHLPVNAGIFTEQSEKLLKQGCAELVSHAMYCTVIPVP